MNDARDRILVSSAFTDSPELTILTFTSFAELSSVQDEWDRFVARSGSDIYFTFGWLESWWRFYGKDRLLRCFLIRNGHEAVAALPFFFEQFGTGFVSIRIAKFVGADSTIPVFFPPTDPDYAESALRLVFEELLGKQHCDAVSLSPVSGLCDLQKSIRAVCTNTSFYSLVRDESRGTHIAFDLPDNFDEYLKGLTKQTRSNYRRDLRALTQIGDVTHNATPNRDVADRFLQFASFHKEQWNESGMAGHFGDWPDSFEFNLRLVENLRRLGQVRIFELAVGGEIISLQFGFRLGDRFFWRLPARDTSKVWDRFGIGRIALIKMIEALIDEGVRRIEAGPGHYDYKIRQGGVEHSLQRMILGRKRARSKLNALGFIWFSNMLNFLYYRVWFQRGAPLFRVPPRPLLRAWIRSRI